MRRKKEIFASSRRLRRKKIIAFAIIFLGGFLLIFAGVTSIFYIPKFRIQRIGISADTALGGAVLAETKKMAGERRFGVFPLDNILFFPEEKIKERILEKYPAIREITFDKDFPDSVFINIAERGAKAIWCDGEEAESENFRNKCFFIDERGVAFSEAPFFSEGVFLRIIGGPLLANLAYGGQEQEFKLGGSVLNQNEFQNILEFKNSIETLNFQAEKIFVKDGGVYEIYLDRSWRVIFDLRRDTEDLFENLKILLEEIENNEKNLEYIDLRFDNKVFYKFR